MTSPTTREKLLMSAILFRRRKFKRAISITRRRCHDLVLQNTAMYQKMVAQNFALAMGSLKQLYKEYNKNNRTVRNPNSHSVSYILAEDINEFYNTTVTQFSTSNDWYDNMRMSKEMFDLFCKEMFTVLDPMPNRIPHSRAMSAENKAALGIYYLSHAISLREVGVAFSIHYVTSWKLLHKFILAVCKTMYDQYVSLPAKSNGEIDGCMISRQFKLASTTPSYRDGKHIITNFEAYFVIKGELIIALETNVSDKENPKKNYDNFNIINCDGEKIDMKNWKEIDPCPNSLKVNKAISDAKQVMDNFFTMWRCLSVDFKFQYDVCYNILKVCCAIYNFIQLNKT